MRVSEPVIENDISLEDENDVPLRRKQFFPCKRVSRPDDPSLRNPDEEEIAGRKCGPNGSEEGVWGVRRLERDQEERAERHHSTMFWYECAVEMELSRV